MGQFSWLTSDTKESISNLKPSKVYMLDDRGNIWEENEYEGYGEFGGKDFYSLLAEMNGKGSDRSVGISLWFNSQDNNKTIPCPKLVRDKNIPYEDLAPPKDCPDQGWT